MKGFTFDLLRKEAIIADLVYKIAASVKKAEDNKEISKRTNALIDFVVTERGETLSFEASGGIGVSAGVSKNTNVARKFNVYQAYDYLNDFLNLILDKYKRVVLLIDELDKEKKEEVLVILDSLKGILEKIGLLTVISLPFKIYREYAKDRMRWNESGNLENVIKDINFP